MSDRAALFANVCAHPDEDTARLVFADWLDEYGESKRAAYLRAGVEQWRLETADTAAVAVRDHFFSVGYFNDKHNIFDLIDWQPLDAELAAISAAKKARKAVRLPRREMAENLPKIRGVKFDLWDVGGFYNELIVHDPEALVANADAIFRAAPIYYLNFQGSPLTAEHARDFVRTGYLSRIRWFRFNSIEPEAIRVLGDHADAAGVKTFAMTCTAQGTEQIEQLVSCERLTGLTNLEVTQLAFAGEVNGDEEFIRLLRCPHFRSIRELYLRLNSIGDATARVIATGGFTELRNLDLGGNLIGTEGAAALAESKLLPNLRLFGFAHNNECSPEGTSRLIASPSLRNLTSLMLTGCGSEAGGLDAGVLAKPCRGPTLRTLELESGPVSSRALAALAKCPAAHGLWYLSLASGNVNDAGLRALTKSEGFQQLTMLDLTNHSLTNDGMEVLAQWPVPLQVLGLYGGALHVKAAKSLIASEHRQKLKRLFANGRGWSHLREHFGQRVVR